MTEPTAEELVALLMRLSREIAALQKLAASLDGKLVEFRGQFSETIPEVRPWTIEMEERLRWRVKGESYGMALSKALGQVIAQADGTFRDLSAARGRVEQLAESNFTKYDLQEWMKPGDGS